MPLTRRQPTRSDPGRPRAVARTRRRFHLEPPFPFWLLALLLLSLLLLLTLPALGSPAAQEPAGQEEPDAQAGTAEQSDLEERMLPDRVEDEVEIEVRGDVVVLSGTVADRETLRELLRAAAGTAGVRAVINELRVEGAQATEEEIGAGLQDAITELERQRVVEPGTIRLTPDPLPPDEPGDPGQEPGIVEPVEPATPEALMEDGEPPEGLEELEIQEEATCVFRQRSFAGSCVETPLLNAGETAVEACLEILRCLDDPACPGVYCRATDQRRGWELAYLIAPR